MCNSQKNVVAWKIVDLLEKAKRHQENLKKNSNPQSKCLREEPITYQYKVMKTQHLKDILGIILKGVAIICIILITYFYWQNKDTGKYEHVREGGSIVVFNTQNGEYTMMRFLDDDLNYRRTLNPVAIDKNKILGKKEAIKAKKDW